jgi:O-antigen/teichoic acid export membrane protein
MSLLSKLGRNIKFLGANTAVKIIITLLITPFIMDKVGKELYGVYILGLTFTGYFGILDFGMLGAIVKFVAEFKGAKNKEGINQIVNVSFSFYFLIGLIVAVMLFVASFFLGSFFRLTGENIQIMRQLLWIAALFSIFSWTGNVFRGVVRGFQMYHWESSVNIGMALLNAGLILWLLSRGYGVIVLMLVTQGANFLSAMVFYFIVRREVGQISFNPLCFRQPTFKKMFGFSIYLFLTSLFDILIFQVDYVVIGAVLTTSAVAIYSIAFSVQQNIRSISPILLEPAWPLSAEMEGAGQYDKQKELLLKGTRFSTLVFIPIVLITFVFMEPFIVNWMGIGFSEAVLPGQILLFWWFFNPYNNLGAVILTAKGLVKKLFWINALNGILNLAVSVILVNIMGMMGVALGTTLPMVLFAFPVILWLILREFKIPLAEFWKDTFAPNLWTYFTAVLLSAGALRVYYPKNVAVTLTEMGLIYVLTLVFTYFIVLKPEEKKQIHKLVYH